jgi:hypothetical protein
MKKKDAIKDAQEKANLTKLPQRVFRYIQGTTVEFDYTHEHLWCRRRHQQPLPTIVTTVTPATTSTD